MKGQSLLATSLLISTLSCASIAMADDVSSKLTNQSKQNGSEGYYLVQEKVISEDECVKVEGNKRLNPGDSARLKIKDDDCKWGVVQYKIFTVSGDKEVGKLGHSFRDGNFSVEIVSECKGSDCSFTGLTSEQNKN
jgi:hypothetical protein